VSAAGDAEQTAAGEAGAGTAGGGATQAASRRHAATIYLFAVALTAGTGAMDVAMFVRGGNVFASVMTGNLVLLGLAAERMSGTLALHAVVAFAGYIAGVAAGGRIVNVDEIPAGRWHRSLPAALLAELVLLAGFTVGWELTGTTPTGVSQIVILVIAAAAMGTQSSAARGLGAQVSTTYMTGTLTNVVAAWVTPGRRPEMRWRDASALLALACGAALGGLVIAVAPSALPAIPLAAVLAVIASIALSDRRSPLTGARGPGRARQRGLSS
jgi:uncharacterized membrane protein YoaK (UPF0700 family)